MFFNIIDFVEKNYKFIDNDIIPSFIKEEDWYINTNTEIDNCISLDYYDYEFLTRIIKKSIENESNAVLLIQNIVRNLFIKNNYKYKTLYETTILEYNPIWNVDGTETLTFTREKDNTGTRSSNGTNNLTDTFNSSVSNNGINNLTDTFNNIKANNGTNNLTDTFNETETTGTNQKTYDTTYNSSDIHLIEEIDTMTNHGKTGTDTHNTTVSNSETQTGTDTHNTAISNTENKSGSDTHNTSSTNTITDNLKEEELYTETKVRNGNIGVTMTQQLINAEREVANFSFLEIVCKDVISEVCVLCG